MIWSIRSASDQGLRGCCTGNAQDSREQWSSHLPSFVCYYQALVERAGTGGIYKQTAVMEITFAAMTHTPNLRAVVLQHSSHLKSNPVLDVEGLGQQPRPSRLAPHVAGVRVDGVQGCLAPPRVPDLCEVSTAASHSAVRRLEVQPLGSRGVSDGDRDARVAVRFGYWFVG